MPHVDEGVTWRMGRTEDCPRCGTFRHEPEKPCPACEYGGSTANSKRTAGAVLAGPKEESDE